MKIRTDFVTNSSSSSFVTINIKTKDYNYYLKEDEFVGEIELENKMGANELEFVIKCAFGYNDYLSSNASALIEKIKKINMRTIEYIELQEVHDDYGSEGNGRSTYKYFYSGITGQWYHSKKELNSEEKKFYTDIEKCRGVELVGTGKDGRAPNHEYMAVGDTVELVREPDNPYDSNAILVMGKGRDLGHLSAYRAKDVSWKLDSGKFVIVNARVASTTPLSQRSARAKNPLMSIDFDIIPSEASSVKNETKIESPQKTKATEKAVIKQTKKAPETSDSTKNLSHKKISDIISIDTNDPNLICVNNEWSFRLPKDAEYDVDCSFDGGFGVGIDLSDPKKAMVIRSKRNGYENLLNFALEKHFHMLGEFETIDDCKHDNRAGDSSFMQKVVKDEDGFFVDLVAEDTMLFGVDLRVRVRGIGAEPFNFLTVLKSNDEDDFKAVAEFMNEIATSIEPLSSKRASTTATRNVNNGYDFDPVVAEQAKVEIFNQLDDIQKSLEALSVQAQAMVEETRKEEERLIASGEKRPFKHKENNLVSEEFLNAVKAKNTFGYRDSDDIEKILGFYETILSIHEANIDDLTWDTIDDVRKKINEIFECLKKREYLYRFDDLAEDCENSVFYSEDWQRINNAVSNPNDFVINDGVLENYKGNAGLIDVPEGVIEIKSFSAFGDYQLAELNLPKSLEKISPYSLGCFDFKEIYIPENVKSIYPGAFRDCNYLGNFKVSDKNMYFSSYNGILCNKDKTELVLYPHARKETEFIIPESIKKIGENAFDKDVFLHRCYTNNFLQKVIIPSNVEIIGEAAFKGLKSLRIVEIHNGVKNIEKDALKNCVKLEEVYIPESVERLLVSVFTGCKALKKIYVSDKLSNSKVLENIEKIATKYNAEIIKTNTSETIDSKKTSKSPIRIAVNTLECNSTLVQKEDQPVVQKPEKVFTDKEKDVLLEKYFNGDDLTSAELTAIGVDDEPANIINTKSSSNNQTEPVIATVDEQQKKSGCYVATAVYGSYDCPEVWTLRRFRDYNLASTSFGRLFIMLYYAVSPTFVKWFGETKWFKKVWKTILDKMVEKLQNEGYESTPYGDKQY